MKKLFSGISLTTYFLYASNVLAADPNLNVQITAPTQGVTAAPNVVLSNAVTIVFILGALAVLFMLIYGAFQWIISGGEKEKVEEARKRIMAAIVGLIILALAFLIIKVLSGLLNINPLGGQLPSLNGPQ